MTCSHLCLQLRGPIGSLLSLLDHFSLSHSALKKDRDAVLHQAKTKGNPMKIDVRISFYPDFSAEVQRRSAKFTEVKSTLGNMMLLSQCVTHCVQLAR